jgi:uncharacterized protein YodC (DUF2158 family)
MNEESTPKIEKPELTVGDVVILNSGGPQMTITFIRNYCNNATCKWINNEKQQQAEFPLACLTKVTWGTPVFSIAGSPLNPNTAITSGQANS